MLDIFINVTIIILMEFFHAIKLHILFNVLLIYMAHNYVYEKKNMFMNLDNLLAK